MNRVFLALLVLTPLALAAGWLGWSPLTVFLLSAAALIPVAKFIGDATEELAGHTTPAVGGLLNATFGNATELIISLFAIQAGLLEVVKASITGSIIGNLLFVLGTAMLVGGWKRERQLFNATAAKAAGSMLLLATIALVIPAIFLMTSGAAATIAVGHLSILVSILLIIAYAANLVFTLHTHKHLYRDEAHVALPTWKLSTALIVLLAAVIAASFLSETLVAAIKPLIADFGWSQIFIGVIVIAIVGNAAEHMSAVTVAVKDRMDLALQISIGSATQVVTFVAPLLVLISLFFPKSMDLIFNPFELISIVFAVFVTNAVVEDGVSTWFEGFQLLIAYAIMAVAFYFHP